MKDAEDKAFDDLAKRQGAWGGGFKAKQAMAADKLQEFCTCHETHPMECQGCKANRLAQPAQEPVECLDCGSHNIGIPANYDSLVDSVKAQPEQEPVAWMYQCTADNSGPVLLRHRTNWAESNSGLWTETPLYTAPPQRPWVKLTDEERVSFNAANPKTQEEWNELFDGIVAKLRSENND